MTISEFWSIVERGHALSPNDMAEKCRLLEKDLERLPTAEILSFAHHFCECYHRANKWDLWGAAYVIHGGCGDDSFMDFHATLISMGRKAFEAALADADSLADFDIDPKWACYEGYQYVPGQVFKRFNYDSTPNEAGPKRSSEPTGTEFDEDEMAPRFPRLVAKYNYMDTDPEELKAKRSRRAKHAEMSERVKQILIKAVVPRSGLVPPPRIVKKILATGKAPEASGLNFEWEPFELDEGSFWTALAQLERASPNDLQARPDLRDKRISLDTGSGDRSDYEHWIASLKQRGLQ